MDTASKVLIVVSIITGGGAASLIGAASQYPWIPRWVSVGLLAIAQVTALLVRWTNGHVAPLPQEERRPELPPSPPAPL